MAALVLVAMLSLIALSILWRGFVLHILWGWFVVPLGAPHIGVAWAIGLAAIASMAVGHKGKNKGDEPDTAENLTFLFLGPLVILGVSWIAHAAM